MNVTSKLDKEFRSLVCGTSHVERYIYLMSFIGR